MSRRIIGQSRNLPLPHQPHPEVQFLNPRGRSDPRAGLPVRIHLTPKTLHSNHKSKITKEDEATGQRRKKQRSAFPKEIPEIKNEGARVKKEDEAKSKDQAYFVSKTFIFMTFM